jgi:penicillin amidase
MLRLFKWLFRIAVALVGLSLIAIVGVYFFLSRSLPDYDAEWTVRGISGPVEIARNTHAVPHIFAEQDADVFFGLGFAHAQDRLW